MLTDDEKAYFDSGGEKVPEQPAPEATPEPAPEAAPIEVAPGQPEAKPSGPDPEHKSDAPEVALEKVNKALRESRNANRELKARLQQIEQQQADVVRRMQETQAKLTPEQQVTMETDPAGYLKQEVETLKQERAAQQQTEQQRQQIAQFTQWYAGQAQQFKAQQPDFDQAYAHYNQARVEQLQEAGLTQQQAAARLQFEEMQIASTAAQSGMNPAQVIYQLSHARGYKPSPKPQDSADKLKQIKTGVESSRPLSSVGGGGQTVNLTWESVANMPSGPEFQKYWNQMMKQEGLQ